MFVVLASFPAAFISDPVSVSCLDLLLPLLHTWPTPWGSLASALCCSVTRVGPCCASCQIHSALQHFTPNTSVHCPQICHMDTVLLCCPASLKYRLVIISIDYIVETNYFGLITSLLGQIPLIYCFN